MCKNNIPTIEERNYNWLHNHKAGKGDELDLIVNVQLMPEWEARGFITKDVEAFREKMNEQDLPGESAVLGTRKPGNRKDRQRAEELVNKRREKMMWYAWSYEPINRGRNGKYNHFDADEFESSVVATKKKSKSEAATFFNRVDRRKSRHNGKAECREIPEYIADDAEEENREFYPEKADGTVDVDFCLRHNWLYADLDDGIYGAEYDEDDDYEPEYMSREWCEMECIDYPEDDYDEDDEEEEVALTYAENSRLKREINLYKDFLGEFNLNKLYQTWLTQNGKGAM